MNFSLLMFDTALMPVFADAAQASAGSDGIACAVGGTALGALATLLGSWIRARYGQKKTVTPEPSPFPVQQQGPFVTTGECKQHRCAIEKRIDAIMPMLKDISNQISSSSARAEERAVQLHRRLDPIVEKVAANAAELDLIKEINFKGGKK